jgi:hypothetical protein
VGVRPGYLVQERRRWGGGEAGRRERDGEGGEGDGRTRERARERGSEGARKGGSEGARERGSEGARERGSEGARERETNIRVGGQTSDKGHGILHDGAILAAILARAATVMPESFGGPPGRRRHVVAKAMECLFRPWPQGRRMVLVP